MEEVVHERPQVVHVARELATRWPALRWPTLGACVAVVVGGLVAAITRPVGLAAGSWVAALLVLVGGVAQFVLGTGRVMLPAPAPTPSRVATEAIVWNLAVIGTVVGSLTQRPPITMISGTALLADLVPVWRALRTTHPARRALAHALRLLVALVFVSVPVGMFLAWTRHA